MKEIRIGSDGNIHGLPSRPEINPLTPYQKRQQSALDTAVRFAETHSAQIYEAIGARFEDLTNLDSELPPIAQVILDSRISIGVFESSIKRRLKASIGQGSPDLPDEMAQTLRKRVWKTIKEIKDSRQAIRQGYVPGR